jgi:tetratricopeptide (TPR) repeat protein
VSGEEAGPGEAWQRRIQGHREVTDLKTIASIGTPGYMAPEALLGTTNERSDVYALGAILYVILTGRPPHRFESVVEFVQTVRTPAPPARQVDPDVPAALSEICEKALAVDPAARTRSARTLADGVRAWQAQSAIDREVEGLLRDAERALTSAEEASGEPRLRHADRAAAALAQVATKRPNCQRARDLSARAARLREQGIREREKASTRRLLVRGGVAVLALGVVAALLVARAIGERRREAETARDAARAGNEILARIFDDIDVRKVKETNTSLESVLARRLLDAATQIEGATVGDPLDVAGLQLRLGRALQGLGYSKEAIPLFSKARDTLAAHRGPDHLDTLGALNSLAVAYREVGELDKAVELSERVLRRTEAAMGARHPDTLAAMHNLAMAYRRAGRTESALPLLEEALRHSRDTLGTKNVQTIASMTNVAKAHLDAGRLEQALPLLQEALDLASEALGAEHPDTLHVLNSLGGCYLAMGKRDRALPYAQRILAHRRALLGADHPDTIESMNNLAAIHHAMGRTDLALPLMEEAVRLGREKQGADHPSTLESACNLAEAYRAARRLDRAVALFEETWKTGRARLGPDHPIMMRCGYGLAAAYWASRRFEDAIPLFEDLVRRAESRHGREHPQTLLYVANLGANYKDAGRNEEAIPLLEEVRRASPAHPELRPFRRALLDAYRGAGRQDEATALLAELLPEVRERLPASSPQLASYLAELGMGLLKQGRWAEAEPLIRECLTIREKLEPEAWTTFSARSLLGGALLGQRRHAEAEPLLLAGYAGMKQREGAIPPEAAKRIPETLDLLIELYSATQQPAELARWREARAQYLASSARGR